LGATTGSAAAALADAGAPAGCHASPDVGTVLPAAPFQSPAASAVCDLKDRIILVEPSSITVLERPGLKKTTGAITKTERTNPCADSGGSAGCSLRATDRYWSPALGAHHVLELSPNGGMGPELIDERSTETDPAKLSMCRPGLAGWGIASCSTAKRLVVVTYDDAANRPQGQPCYRMRASMWTGSGDEVAGLEGDLDRAASVNGRWVLRFPAQQPVGQDIVLSFERGAATLQVGGERETCAVSRLLSP
jgi:hypothetical protein